MSDESKCRDCGRHLEPADQGDPEGPWVDDDGDRTCDVTGNDHYLFDPSEPIRQSRILVEFPDEEALQAAITAIASRPNPDAESAAKRAEFAMDSALLHHELETPEEGMQTFTVEVLRTVAVSVTVEGLTSADAVDVVKQQDFPLPEIGAGTVLDSWEYVVYGSDDDHTELYREN